MTATARFHRHVAILSFALLFAACTERAPGTEPEQNGAAVSSLTIASGGSQTAAVNTAFGSAFRVRALTSADAPVPGVEIVFTVASGTATLNPVSARTDANGEASTQVMASGATGALQVTASVKGTAKSVTFAATVSPPAGDSTAAPAIYNPDWTDATHGKVAPVYATVFPQSSVNTIEIVMTPAQWTSIRANMTALYGYDFGRRPGGPGNNFPAADPDYVAVTMTYGGKAWKKVGFRLKGNSTLGFAWGSGNYKLPFRLKMNEWEDTYPAIKNQRFYGFKELSFSPGRSDPSLIREKSTADILRLAGIPSAQTAFYRVFVDFGAGLKYCGVYTAVEVIDDTMVKDQFGEDKGNIYKPESALRTFVTSEFEKKNNKTGSYADVQAFVAALNSSLRTTDPAAWRTNLQAVFNVDHFLKWLAIDNVLVNWDSYGTLAHNYYLYNAPGKGLTWIPWDHNEAMIGSPGITGITGGPGNNKGLSLSMNEVSDSWPLIRYLADDPVYFAQYKAHMKAFNTDVLVQSSIDAMFNKYTALISPWVVGPNGEQPNYTYTSNALFGGANSDLKNHIRNRKTMVSDFTR